LLQVNYYVSQGLDGLILFPSTAGMSE